MPRRPRGKRDAPPPVLPRVAPRERHEESTTARLEMTPELIASMMDDSERPTLRMPARPPFATPDDEVMAREQKINDATVRKRVLVGPDGVARMLDEDELEQSTRVFETPKILLGRGKSGKRKR